MILLCRQCYSFVDLNHTLDLFAVNRFESQSELNFYYHKCRTPCIL